MGKNGEFYQMNADTNYVQRVVLIVLLSLITLSFFHSPGTGDVKYWLQWMKIYDTQGPFMGFETTQWDYPPFSSIILFGTARMSHLFSTDYFTSLKLSLTLFLVISSIIFWVWTRDFFITVILHLSLLLNSVLLVYIDIFFAPWFILALMAIKERRMTAFTIFYSIACLIKWQPIVIAPFLLLYILNIKQITDIKEIDLKVLLINILLPFSVIILITLLLYKMYFLMSFITGVTTKYLSGDALNFSWIMTYFLHVFYPDIFGPLKDGQSGFLITSSLKVLTIPKALFLIFYTGVFLSFLKQNKTFENLIYYSLIGYLAYFIFNTGVFENHLFLASILAVILFFLNKEHLMISIFIIIMSNLNLIIFFGTDGKGLSFSRVVGVDITLLLSLLNVAFFLLIWNSACLKWKRLGKMGHHNNKRTNNEI